MHRVPGWNRAENRRLPILQDAAGIHERGARELVCAEYKPEVVSHAAARRHLPTPEQYPMFSDGGQTNCTRDPLICRVAGPARPRKGIWECREEDSRLVASRESQQ